MNSLDIYHAHQRMKTVSRDYNSNVNYFKDNKGEFSGFLYDCIVYITYNRAFMSKNFGGIYPVPMLV